MPPKGTQSNGFRVFRTKERNGRLVFAELKAGGGRLQPDQQVWLEALRETAAETYLWTPDDWPTIEELFA